MLIGISFAMLLHCLLFVFLKTRWCLWVEELCAKFHTCHQLGSKAHKFPIFHNIWICCQGQDLEWEWLAPLTQRTGLPMIPSSLPYLHPLPSAAAGFYLISGSRVLPVPQLQVPLIASQALPTNTDSSTVPPQFTRELVTPSKPRGVQLPKYSQQFPGSFQPLHFLSFANVILSFKTLS